ncbi:hypothetical protein E2C01_033598 [Portunus trituberculatus]|uniref:Uncharacterized protein n=1 Tax=Portunus trituberculatus TaxID=210409 RepID=A0A5B7F3W1_PORTR|nr:hypothetical protein [Portunus trituberculatus]
MKCQHLAVVVVCAVAVSALSVSRPEEPANDDGVAKLLGIGVVGLPTFPSQAFTVTVVETVSAQTTVTTDCALMVDYCIPRSSLGRGGTPTIEPTIPVLIATLPGTITSDAAFISSNTNDEPADSLVKILDSSIDETIHTTQNFGVEPIATVNIQTPPAAETPTHTIAIESPQESPRDGDLIIPASAVTLCRCKAPDSHNRHLHLYCIHRDHH